MNDDRRRKSKPQNIEPGEPTIKIAVREMSRCFVKTRNEIEDNGSDTKPRPVWQLEVFVDAIDLMVEKQRRNT